MRSRFLPKTLTCLEWMGLGKDTGSQVNISRLIQVFCFFWGEGVQNRLIALQVVDQLDLLLSVAAATKQQHRVQSEFNNFKL